MYKVLIIDDEVLIANGLQYKIQWEQLGCTVCGVAYDGIGGKRLIDELRPQIVVSDIVMPGKTGLELAEYVFFNHPGTIIVLLTAYDKFQYAQQAMKFGVKDYILKPINKSEIVRVIHSSVAKLKAHENTQFSINKLESIVKEVKPLVTNTLLFDITLNGNDEINMVQHNLNYFDINIGKGAVMVFQIDLKQGQCEDKLLSFAAKNIIQEIFQQYKYGCDIKEKEAHFIVISKFDITIADNIIKSRLVRISQEIQRSVAESIKIPLSAGIGSSYKSIYELHNSYMDALKALQLRFFSSGAMVMHYDDVKNIKEGNYYFSEHSHLYERIKEGDVKGAIQTAEDIFVKLKEIMNEKYIKGVCLNILQNLTQMVSDNEDCSNFLSVEGINYVSTFVELKELLTGYISFACQLTGPKLKNTSSNMIDKALRMIRSNYSDKSLSLQQVADVLNINSSYLSRLFKKETDMNFMDYLTLVRVEKAKALLIDTDIRNAEISDKVGFCDARYFSQVFRKKMGVTPSEFRLQFLKSKF